MTTITIALAEDRLTQLKETAARLGVTPEELARAGIEELLARPEGSLTPEDLAGLLRPRVTLKQRRSIMELEGLGSHIWADVDVQAYVDRERASWDG